jgi:hypothetical protein
MIAHFHTNLDEAQRYVQDMNGLERWKGPLPRTGDRIEFEVRKGFVFELQVVAVRFDCAGEHVKIELHLPPRFETIAAW